MTTNSVPSTSFLPRTFLEWGVAVPFTTPSLASGRVRPGRRGRSEMIMQAAEADEAMGLLTRFHLVTRLLEEAGLERVDWTVFTGDNQELRAMIRGLLAQVAPQLGTPVDGVFEQIEAIADLSIPVGPPIEGSIGRNELMLDRLRTFVASLGQWSVGETGASAAEAKAVLDVAARTVREGANAQLAARQLLSAVTMLLRGWRQPAGDHMRAALTRPEWLVDGWAQVCGQWEAVVREERAAQRQMLQQILASLPMLDPNDRSGASAAETHEIRFDRGRRVKLHEDWRTGLSVMDGRTRAELIRAATA